MAMRPEPRSLHRYAHSTSRTLSGACWLVLALATVATARADSSFLRIEALTVDANDPNHDRWINVLAFAKGSVLGPLVSPALGGAQASPPKFTDITIKKHTDKSSPSLILACCTGKHYPKAQIDFVRPPAGGSTEGPTYMQVTLSDVLITGYSFASSSSDLPLESVSINFSKFTIGYTDRANTGSFKVTYDVHTTDTSFSTGVPQNKPPTLSPVSTKLGVSPQPLSFTVTIGDAESSPGALTMTGASDNAALLPVGSITFTGTGATRTVTLLPASSGLAHVTLTVSDGTATTSVFFLVIFNHPPPGPTLNLSNTAVPEHTSAGTTIGLFSGIPPLLPGAPGLTLVDSAGGRFRIELDQLIINDPILLDFETSPRPQIVVAMTDPLGLPYHVPFIIQVEDVPEGPFDVWRNQFFNADERLDPSISGPEADPDLDGRKNLAEYGLFLPPKSGAADANIAPRLGEVTIENKKYLTLIYRRRSNDPALSVTPFISDNFGAWNSGPAHFAVMSQVVVAPDCEEITLRALTPKSDRFRQFTRIEIVR
jgi:type VI secretion system secreted protein Hcp